MQKKLIASLFIASIMWVAPTQAAIPPMSQDMREAASDLVVEGVVLTMSRHGVQSREGNEDFIDIQFTAKVSTDQGIITVKYWKPLKRPQGWGSSQGQNGSLEKDQHVRLYLKQGQNNTYDLIMPNGIDWLDKDAL